MSEPTATFSTSFQSRLRIVAINGGMTSTKALGIVEKYITDITNAKKTYSGYDAFVFKIPANIKNSPNFTECMYALKTNFESCGFHENREIKIHSYGPGYMQPAEFIFITNGQHTCNFGCQKDGCEMSNVVCNYDDPTCHTLMVCL